MSKQKKILDLRLNGFHIAGYQTQNKINPFRVYILVPGHRRLIAKYGDFFSVLCFVKDIFLDGMDTKPMAEVVEWARQTGSIW